LSTMVLTWPALPYSWDEGCFSVYHVCVCLMRNMYVDTMMCMCIYIYIYIFTYIYIYIIYHICHYIRVNTTHIIYTQRMYNIVQLL
jgi:hypothetical protein